MANIAIVTADPASVSATSSRDALVALGHTVAFVTEADAPTHDFGPYDLIVTSQTNVSNRVANAAVLTPLNEAGKPMIIGLLEAGVSSTTGGTPGLSIEMGLTGSLAVGSYKTDVIVAAPGSHAIAGRYPPNSFLKLFTSYSWVAAVASGQSYLGTGFMEGTGTYVGGLVAASAIPAGTAKLVGGPTGGRIVLFPTFLSSGAYTAEHRALLGNAVEFALTGTVVLPPEVHGSALHGYAVQDYTQERVGVSVLNGYAVMNEIAEAPPEPPPSASKARRSVMVMGG